MAKLETTTVYGDLHVQNNVTIDGVLVGYEKSAVIREELDTKMSKDNAVFTDKVTFSPSTSFNASVQIPSGSTPDTTYDGDIWRTPTALLIRIGDEVKEIATTVSWSTVSKEEAEAGTATIDRLWTAERVRQSIVAYHNLSTTELSRALLKDATDADMRARLGLGTAALLDFDPATKANVNHTHLWADISNKPTTFTPSTHTHVLTDVTGLDAALLNKVDKVEGKGLSSNDFTDIERTKLTNIAAGATKNDSDANLKNRANHTGTQAIGTIENLQSTLNGKAASVHTHLWTEITNKPATYAPSSHQHPIAEITDLQSTLDNKVGVSRNVTAGTGLTGGGTLASDINIAIGDNVAPITATSLGTTDLNTLWGPNASGFYYQTRTANATLESNYPDTVIGVLEVYTVGELTQQRYTTSSAANALVYTRTSLTTTNSWRPWVCVSGQIMKITSSDYDQKRFSGALVHDVGTLTVTDKEIGFRLDIVGPCVVNIPAGHTLKSVDNKNTVVADGGATLIKLTATQWWLAGNLE